MQSGSAGEQKRFTVWENILLICARNATEALRRARKRAKEDEGDSKGTLVWDGKPSRMVLGGIRRLIECEDPDTRPGDGTEVTYSEFVVESQAS